MAGDNNELISEAVKRHRLFIEVRITRDGETLISDGQLLRTDFVFRQIDIAGHVHKQSSGAKGANSPIELHYPQNDEQPYTRMRVDGDGGKEPRYLVGWLLSPVWDDVLSAVVPHGALVMQPQIEGE